jgi:17beta-estradiol 17-dehydrogenase / very-long-chain 3-oxoacyl-CoA reductase
MTFVRPLFHPRVRRLDHGPLLCSLGLLPLLSHPGPWNRRIIPLFLSNSQIKQFRKGDRPAYAIVTGPTSGIGKAFAFALAQNGFNLILVSRSLTKLESLESDIKRKYPNVDVRLVDLDIGAYPLDQGYLTAVTDIAMSEGDIRILVNNAGVSHDIPVTFEDMATDEMEDIVAVNVGGVLRATKEALPYLLSDKSLLLGMNLIVGKRRGGLLMWEVLLGMRRLR